MFISALLILFNLFITIIITIVIIYNHRIHSYYFSGMSLKSFITHEALYRPGRSRSAERIVKVSKASNIIIIASILIKTYFTALEYTL